MINPHTRYRTQGGVIFRHPIWHSANPPPNDVRKTSINRKISTSTAGGRWDHMVLNQKAKNGNPHTAVFQDVWKGWDATIRTIEQMICGNTALFWTKTYTETLQINVPPPHK